MTQRPLHGRCRDCLDSALAGSNQMTGRSPASGQYLETAIPGLASVSPTSDSRLGRSLAETGYGHGLEGFPVPVQETLSVAWDRA